MRLPWLDEAINALRHLRTISPNPEGIDHLIGEYQNDQTPPKHLP